MGITTIPSQFGEKNWYREDSAVIFVYEKKVIENM